LRSYEYSSEIPKAFALVYWPTADMSDIRRTRRLLVLAEILDDRMRIKVREELGETYSPYARNVSSDTFTGYGYLFAMVEAAPDQVSKIAELVSNIGRDLSSSGITRDELERARKPLITMIEEYRRTNRYWMDSVMGRSQEQPQRLEWARSFIGDFQAVTEKEIVSLAKTYLDSVAALPVVITPSAGTNKPPVATPKS
jgi:zinc protease